MKCWHQQLALDSMGDPPPADRGFQHRKVKSEEERAVGKFSAEVLVAASEWEMRGRPSFTGTHSEVLRTENTHLIR